MTPLDQLNVSIGILVGIGTIFTMLVVVIRWMVKHYLEEIKHELKPNGGGSIKDQVNHLQHRIDEADSLRRETNKKIDNLYNLFVEYIAKSSNK
tara:strand:+ start:3986 stop:4267 length:282 start_codon:yes stop_codon:yes gene_type:complete